MKLGIAISTLDSWHFFHEIADDLKLYYETKTYRFEWKKFPVFHARTNKTRFRRSFGKFLKDNDVVFFEWASGLLEAATREYPKKCKILTRLHSYELLEWAPKINWEAVDKIILVSEAMRRRFAELYPSQAHKTVVIYNGFSLDKYQYAEHREFHFNLGMLCNILPIKRIYEVVLVIASLKQQGLKPHLRIAGIPVDDLRYFAAIKSIVYTLDLEDNVVFDGFVTDTPAWLQNIDILISNSYWEGQPVSLLEGMACGCYCLSHHWDGAEEVLPIENLYYFDSELIDKIVAYIDSPTEEKEANRAHMRAIALEKFNIEQTKQKIRGVIHEVATMKVAY
jgi:glycosyltransferase involved in cell wall biosynthesis